MHDNKEDAVYETYLLMKKLKMIQTEAQMYNHPLYEKIFCQLFQNEIELVFDLDKNGDGTVVKVKLGDGKVLK